MNTDSAYQGYGTAIFALFSSFFILFLLFNGASASVGLLVQKQIEHVKNDS